MIIDTAVLHNICRLKKLDDISPEVEIPEADVSPTESSTEETFSTERANLIAEYFHKLLFCYITTLIYKILPTCALILNFFLFQFMRIELFRTVSTIKFAYKLYGLKLLNMFKYLHIRFN